MPPRLLPLLALSLCLSACANDIRVSADWDPASDLAARKTFALAPGKEAGTILPGGHSVEIGSDFYRTRVQKAIVGELLNSDRAEAAPGQAQLLVNWTAQSETVWESDTVAYRNHLPHENPWQVDRYETRDYHHEWQTLTVTLLNAKTNSILWTGSVRAPEITDATPEDREKRVRELVRRLFEKLPKPALKQP